MHALAPTETRRSCMSCRRRRPCAHGRVHATFKTRRHASPLRRGRHPGVCGGYPQVAAGLVLTQGEGAGGSTGPAAARTHAWNVTPAAGRCGRAVRGVADVPCRARWQKTSLAKPAAHNAAPRLACKRARVHPTQPLTLLHLTLLTLPFARARPSANALPPPGHRPRGPLHDDPLAARAHL